MSSQRASANNAPAELPPKASTSAAAILLPRQPLPSKASVTALQFTAADDRVSAVFVLSGSSALAATDEAVMSAIKVPVGYVTGNPREDAAAPNAMADYQAMSDGVAAMIASRNTGDHVVVSTDAASLDDVRQIGLDWMDLALYGTGEAADMLLSPTVCASCDAGTWTLMSKSLETLRK